MKRQFTRCICVAVLAVTLLITVGICSAQQDAAPPAPKVEEPPVIEPEAMDALKKMGRFLHSLKSFSVSNEISADEVLLSGQKIMINGTVQMTVQRPNRFHMVHKVWEIGKDQQFFYDGKTFTIYGNTNKYYASFPAPDTIGKLIAAAAEKHDIQMPLSDLFIWGTDKAEVDDIQSAFHVYSTRIGDVLCDHYAFRQADIDWQLWIKKGDKPLPIKLVITTKQEEGSPQYVSIFKWNLSPKINDQLFTFVPPKDSYKIKFAEMETAAETTN